MDNVPLYQNPLLATPSLTDPVAASDPSPVPAPSAPRPAPFPILESSRRTAGFQGGEPVRMIDGQIWYVPKPRVRFGPDDEDGYTVFMTVPGRDGYNDLYEQLTGLGSPESESVEDRRKRGADYVVTQFRVAVFLIRTNYDLTTPELRSILQFSFDEDNDPEAFELRRTVLRIAEGLSPKPSVGGDDTP